MLLPESQTSESINIEKLISHKIDQAKISNYRIYFQDKFCV